MNTDDNKDGSYTLSFSGAVAGECRVVVRLDNNEMAPQIVTFVKGADEEEKKEEKKEEPKKKAGGAK